MCNKCVFENQPNASISQHASHDIQEIKLGQTINLENKLMDCFIPHRSLLILYCEMCSHYVNDSEIDYVESVYEHLFSLQKLK